MLSRKQYEEHSERDLLPVSIASYHFEQVAIPLHWHREVEFIFTADSGFIELEGKSYPYEAGDIICINQGILHRTSNPVKRADLLVFDLRILLSPLLQNPSLFLNPLEKGQLLFPFSVSRTCPSYPDILQSFQNCIDCIRTKKNGWEVYMQTGLLHFLELFWKNHILLLSAAHSYNPQITAVKDSIQFMKQHFDQTLSIQQLAEQVALSPSHYIRVFQHYTGQTPIVFLNNIRIEKAASFLLQGRTVTETALLVGFSNISYFIRQFNKKYAQTPKQYQISHISPQNF
ncbi:MAG: helix-turn-helix domain-containing protein [Candidatus Merdivicinus sp.]|jgi:AraC-like DNA-binding protein